MIKTKKIRKITAKIADIWWVISLLILIISLIPISHKIDNIQQQLNQQDAQSTLMNYFSYIEQWKLDKAFDLFSQEKKYNHNYTGFVDWLSNFVAFEWLKITPLIEKDSAIQKVFLVEFWFKKRWMTPVDVKWWFYLKYNDNKREINYSNVLYENWRKAWACSFYRFEICK